MAHEPKAFIALVQLATGWSQEKLGDALGVSRRTTQRWGDSGAPSYALADLAKVAHPHDAALAREIAAAAGTTLAALGLEEATLPAAPAAPPSREPPEGVVDALVCAAAEEMDMKPAEVRRGLLAAFARANEIGADVAFVARVLRKRLATVGNLG